MYAALNKVVINEMSVTVVATRYPRKLLSFLKNQYTVRHTQPGIYLVDGDTCPTQVIVSEELPEEDNLWLNSLRDDLSPVQLERFALSKEPKLPMDAYIQVIGEANAEALEDLHMQKKKGVILTEKLDAFFTEKYGPQFIAKGEAKGIAIGEVKGIAIGEAKGRAEGEAMGTVLTALRVRFKKVPKDVEKAVRAMVDLTALKSLASHAETCQSLEEFAKHLP